jgi:DNA-binding transcriptional ArsR family regulator
MATKSKRQSAQKLAKALSHPVREEVLTILTEREASAIQIARELDVEGPAINYHIKCLRELGFAEKVRSCQVKGAGATEHFYKAVVRPLIDLDEWAAMHPLVAHHFAWRSACKPVEDFTEAVEGGLLEDVEDVWVVRTPMLLDAEGRREMAALHKGLYEESLEVQARSDERRVESGEDGVRTTSAQMCFEIPTKTAN